MSNDLRHFIQIVEGRRTFKNELDNKIITTVSEKEIDGEPGVMIKIVGPKSETENHITRVEAKNIYEQLKQIFDED